MFMQLDEATMSHHAVLTIGNIQAMETEDTKDRQSGDSTLLHHHWCPEERDGGGGGLEAHRCSEQALTITNQLGLSAAETDC